MVKDRGLRKEPAIALKAGEIFNPSPYCASSALASKQKILTTNGTVRINLLGIIPQADIMTRSFLYAGPPSQTCRFFKILKSTEKQFCVQITEIVLDLQGLTTNATSCHHRLAPLAHLHN